MKNVLLVVILSLTANVHARYTFQARAIRYTNINNQDWDGGCCDVICSDDCDVYFTFCLRDKNRDAAVPGYCWQGASVRTYNHIAAKVIDFPSTGALYSGANVNNPVTFTIAQPWPVSFQLLVQTDDYDPLNGDDLVDRNVYNLDMSPNGQWSNQITVAGRYNAVTFTVQIRVSCQPNYYSSDCTVYCVPQNDNTNGFYDCDTNGNKVCRTGYSNPSGNCLTPICSSGCSTQNGYCNVPNQCLCNTGWTGSNCNECIPKSGCSSAHGHCTQPNECICETGYGGSLCTEDHDVCGHQQPCVHGGTCTNIIPDNYQCSCALGYTGTNCEININDCASNPCQNNGSCIDQVNSYVCQCADGWTGTNCETNIDDCASNPCQNNGSCTDLVNGHSCSCVVGFIGPNCEGHHCDSFPCNNNGTCIKESGTSGYSCVCTPGYTDLNCTSEIDECDFNPCQNNATCIDAIADYQCICSPGFTGENCQFDIDECDNSSCSNHSICVDDIDSYTCICDTGYTGQFCDIEVDYCSSNPCLNNATCNSYPGFYTCNCQDGFNGTNCEEDIDYCEPNPCENGGTCQNIVRGYVCTCPPGLTGLTCLTEVSACDSNPCPPSYECIDNLSSIGGTSYDCQICIENICEILPITGSSSVPGTPVPTAVPTVGNNNLSYIAFVVVGPLLAFLLFFIVYCCYRKRKKYKRLVLVPTHNDQHFNENPTYVSPEDIVSPRSTLQRSTNTPGYGTTSSKLKSKLLHTPLSTFSKRRSGNPTKQDYEELLSSNEEDSVEQKFDRSAFLSGSYDELLCNTAVDDINTSLDKVIENPHTLQSELQEIPLT